MGEDRQPPGLLRRAAYTLLTLLLFALVLELGLALFGLGNPRARLSLTRGFSNAARYIVPHEKRPGWFHTQMFSGESPEVNIGPKGARIRVMMFGGSNVEGFPTAWIEEQLNAALPEPGFEVINLGRRGYGSERDRILLRQALELQPDIVLLYEGHNEFVEAGFAWELDQAGPAPWMTETIESLSGFRTMNAAIELAERLRPVQAPEAEHHRTIELEKATPERTAGFYAVFHDNLAAMTDLARAAGARVLLATVVWNDFEPPFATAFEAGTSEESRAEIARLRGEALALIPERFRPGLVQTNEIPALHLQPTDWGDALTEAERDTRRAANAGRVAPSLRPLAGLFGGEPLVGPLDLVAPEVPPLLATMHEVALRKLSRNEREKLARSMQTFDAALELAPDHPITLFDRGLVAWLLGVDADASQFLRAASAGDRAPVHANDRINDATRTVAAERAADPDVRFVDVDKLVRETMPAGLVGYEIMQDGCHLHRDARPKLVSLLVPELAELAREVASERN